MQLNTCSGHQSLYSHVVLEMCRACTAFSAARTDTLIVGNVIMVYCAFDASVIGKASQETGYAFMVDAPLGSSG